MWAAGGVEDVSELADAVRRLMDAAVLTAAGDSERTLAAKEIEAITLRLEDAGLRETFQTRDVESMRRGERPYSPVIGRANPIAPPMTVRMLDDTTVVGECILRQIHEGPPGAVHGGWVATLLDQLLGHATAAAGHPGYTGELTVRYRRPTPYDVPLTLRGRTDEVDGRRVHASAEIVVDDVVTAEARALFLKPGQPRGPCARNLP